MFGNGNKFFDMGAIGTNIVLQNVSNGSIKDVMNRTDLYYIDNITFTMLFYDNISTFAYSIVYRGSDMRELGRDTITERINGAYHTFDIEPEDASNSIYYVDINLPNVGVLRYQNIKPLKYGDSTYYEDIYFYNSYGGVSFCPFTASQEEEYDSEVETYSPHHFDVYINPNKAYKKKYINDVEEEITLKSHYINKDGIYTYKELLYAYTAWKLDKNGNKVEIIIDDVSFEQIQHGIYQCILKYKTREIK